MAYVVLAAELATLVFLAVFCLALASDGVRGAVFTIGTRDVVGRTLIRSAQVAFVTGYALFFLSTVVEAVGLL